MDIDTTISNITRHKNNLSKYNEEIHKKQRKINENNRSIMDYKGKITKTKNITSIKNYYSKIANLEKNNETLQKEIGTLQKRTLNEQKEVNKLEKQMLNNMNRTTERNDIVVQENFLEKSDKLQNNPKEYKDIVKEFCKDLKKSGLKTQYGTIINIKDPGSQGENGNVLFGVLNNHDVAIKVLYNNESGKINRFFDEFINVFLSLQKVKGIVELYLYEEIQYKGEKIYYIVMKQYKSNLLKNKLEVNEENVIKLFYDLCNILKRVHDANIVHRDIKPENILIDEEDNVVLCDFGIAYFNPEEYQYTGHTLAKEILGNRKFSAPEQNNKDANPNKTMDIYALGQIIQWFVTKDIHSGTGRKLLNTYIKGKKIEGLDIIVDKCLRFDPKERYQSIDEIYLDLQRYGVEIKKEVIKEEIFSKEFDIEIDGLGRGEKIVVI